MATITGAARPTADSISFADATSTSSSCACAPAGDDGAPPRGSAS
jgi:hypothetical protein